MTLAARHMAGKGKRFVERCYRLRVLGLALGFFCVASVFLKQERGPLLWGLLAFHAFIWPHVARRAAYAWNLPYRGERANLLVDALFGGFWVAAMRFNVLPSAIALVMLSMDNVAAGGLALFAWGLVCHIAGLLIGLLVVGYAFEPTSTMPTILACLPVLIAYPLALGWSMHQLSQQLARQSRSLEHLSRIDGLTGLLNRRSWENLLAGEFAQCRTAGWTSSLLLIDLDHFKRINDTYGHPTGDAVLKMLAEMLREHFHDSDCIGRYGGEEFGVVLRGTTLSIAAGAAERLVATVRQNVRGENPSFPCTLSIGVAQFDPAMSNHVEWLQKADANLYSAKLGGRDRVVIAKETASTS